MSSGTLISYPTVSRDHVKNWNDLCTPGMENLLETPKPCSRRSLTLILGSLPSTHLTRYQKSSGEQLKKSPSTINLMALDLRSRLRCIPSYLR
jgi:hypothetical protein